MLTPSKGCILVAFSAKRATCCFDTSLADIRHSSLWFRRVLLAARKQQTAAFKVTTDRAVLSIVEISLFRSSSLNCPCSGCLGYPENCP